VPTSLRFYRDLLGFRVLSEVPDDDRCDWVLLQLHESELMLNTAYEADDRPSAPDPARVATRRATGCGRAGSTWTIRSSPATA
jgi:catechol 2,3-dioxygenase-like lactoylglutathione lyase family enzyme